MPIISLKISHPRAESLVGECASLAASLTARYLGKDPKLTAVAVDVVSPERWFVGGRSLANQQVASFFLEVRVTDGTNTKDQKESFIGQTFAAFGAVLGDLHPESYVHVVDARADAYGYGGVTQERRFVEARHLVAAAATAKKT